MEYRGTFEDGIVRPDNPVNLPNGTPVEFHPIGGRPGYGSAKPGPSTTSSDELQRLDRLARANRTLDEIAAEQGVKPIESIDELAVEGLEDEDVDAFIRSVKEGRR